MLARGGQKTNRYEWPEWVKVGVLFKPAESWYGHGYADMEKFVGMILEVQGWDNYHGTMPCIKHFWMIESGKVGDPNHTLWKPIIYFQNDDGYETHYVQV